MAENDKANWDYKPAGELAGQNVSQEPSSTPTENISWTAKEFIEHDRGRSWYVMLILGSALLAVAVYFITHDYFAVGAIVAVGVIAAVYASHKPKELPYELSSRNIKVGERTYSYNMFKSFAVAHEGEHTSIVLEPVKKYLPQMTLYFPAEMENQITNAIGNQLPVEEHQPNVTERLSHRLRF
jgi:hypothetical protein